MRKIKLLFVLIFMIIGLVGCKSSSGNAEESIDYQDINQIYRLAVQAGYDGTIDEWFDLLRGEKGNDGIGVVSITKTGSEGLVDTYTITFTDGSTTTFTVTNGKDGAPGEKGDTGKTGDRGDTGEIGAQGEKGDKGDTGETGRSAYDLYVEVHPEYTKTETEWLEDLVNGKLVTTETVKYTVTFNSNGGSEVKSQEVIELHNAIKPQDPTKEGYKFDGWYIGEEKWSFNGYVVTKDITLTAKWTYLFNVKDAILENDVYKLDVNNNVSTINLLKYIETENNWIVTNDIDGYNVLSKNVNLNIGDNTFYIFEEDNNDYMVHELVIRRLPMYTISFVTNNEDSIESYQVQEKSLIESLPAISKKGYTLSWDYNISNPVMKNEVITANWAINNYKIEYNLNDGINNEQNPSTYTVLDEVTFSIPTKRGYEFDGWYLEKSFNTQVESIEKGTIDDINVYAKWTPIVYSITYHLNEGIYNGNNPNTYTILDEAALDAPTKQGYVFDGWYLEGSFDNRIESIEKGTIGDIDIYAKWICHVNYSVENDEVAVTGYNEESGADEVIILDSYEGKTVTTIANNAFKDCESLTSIIIPDSVTSIGDSAFAGCASLISITIPDGVTSIGDSAFAGCASLISITIPDGVTSIPEGLLNGCASLTKLVIPFIGDREHAAKDPYQYPLGYIFGSSNYAGSRVVVQQYCGESSSTIVSKSYRVPVKLSEVELTNTTYISYGAFYNCITLKSITIPESVISISNKAFENCVNLSEVHINSLQSWLNISFGSYESNPLYYAHNLYVLDEMVTELIIPDSLTKIRNYVFYGCTSLTNITIPDSVTSIGDYAFDGCASLISITIPDSVTSIGVSAFAGCTNLTSITIPDSVTSIRSSVFAGCTNLTSITIPDSVTSIGYQAFHGCASLTSITIPEGVTSIGVSAFSGCTGLTSITIPEGVTSIEETAFYECASLTSIIIPDSVISIGSNAFVRCTSLLSITIPEGVTNIGNFAFGGCSSLTSITIPDGVTSIPKGLLDGCTGLTSIIIPDSVISIGYQAFFYCTSLTSVTIPDSVISIGSQAFSYCTSLTSVTIPDSVTSIGDNAFTGRKSQVIIYYNGTYDQYAELDNKPENVMVYYYSESDPGENGNYWHYVNGAPKLW